MHDAPEPLVTASEYSVSILPPDFSLVCPDSRYDWEITVVSRGPHEIGGDDKWAVMLGQHRCFGRHGKLDWESRPSEREDDWLADHRFTLDEALALAKNYAPLISVGNGMTAARALAEYNRRKAAGLTASSPEEA